MSDLGPAPDPDGPSDPLRGARTARITLFVMAGAALLLGVLGLGVVVMSGDALDPWPGLTMLGIGLLATYPSLALAALAQHRVRAGRPARLGSLRATLRATPPVLALALGIAVAAWIWWEPALWLPTVATALVAAQVGLLAHLLSR